MTNETLYLGANPLNASSTAVKGDYVTRDGESFYRIANVDGMDDFFISVVSDSNHWMFISTRGGPAACRDKHPMIGIANDTDEKIIHAVNVSNTIKRFTITSDVVTFNGSGRSIKRIGTQIQRFVSHIS